MSFSAAAADASQKTHVTVRSFNDASMVEYALLLVAVLLLAAASYSGHIVSPLSGQLAIIANGLQTSLDAIGGGGVIP
jgi:Flp pilus assembly pilin Flp